MPSLAAIIASSGGLLGGLATWADQVADPSGGGRGWPEPGRQVPGRDSGPGSGHHKCCDRDASLPWVDQCAVVGFVSGERGGGS
jgi:hypothetical protein